MKDRSRWAPCYGRRPWNGMSLFPAWALRLRAVTEDLDRGYAENIPHGVPSERSPTRSITPGACACATYRSGWRSCSRRRPSRCDPEAFSSDNFPGTRAEAEARRSRYTQSPAEDQTTYGCRFIHGYKHGRTFITRQGGNSDMRRRIPPAGDRANRGCAAYPTYGLAYAKKKSHIVLDIM